MRSDACATESDEPDSVGNGPNPNTIPPNTAPEAMTPSKSTPSKVIAAAYFESTSRARPTGRTSNERSVPDWASPAIASPANSPSARDMKNGCTTARPVSGANSPLCTIWSRNGGASSLADGVGGESFTARTMRKGTPPKAAAIR